MLHLHRNSRELTFPLLLKVKEYVPPCDAHSMGEKLPAAYILQEKFDCVVVGLIFSTERLAGYPTHPCRLLLRALGLFHLTDFGDKFTVMEPTKVSRSCTRLRSFTPLRVFFCC